MSVILSYVFIATAIGFFVQAAINGTLGVRNEQDINRKIFVLVIAIGEILFAIFFLLAAYLIRVW